MEDPLETRQSPILFRESDPSPLRHQLILRMASLFVLALRTTLITIHW